MKKLIFGLLLLFAPLAVAQQQTVTCAAPGVPCSLVGPFNTLTGDKPPVAFGKLNANEGQLYNALGTQGLLFGTASWPSPLRPGTSTDVLNLFGGSIPGTALSPLAAYTLYGNCTSGTATPIACSPPGINALDMGCRATVNVSTADSGPCIQAALNAASATNLCAILPGGTYYLRTRINWPSAGACLRGVGWNLTTAGTGSWIHVVTSQFVSGGPQAGNHPFQIGSAAAVNFTWVDGIAFTEDQPADTSGWAPNSYGAMFLIANGSVSPRFTNNYFAGVNYAIEFLSIEGAYLENNYFQTYTTGVQIDHNGDWLHANHNHWNDFFCSTTACPNITAYSQINAIAFQSNRNDNPSFIDTEGFGLFSCLALGTDATGVTTNAKVTQMDCDKSYHTVYITAAGTSAALDQLQGHTFNFAGTGYLRGGTIISETGGTAVLTISNLRCQNAGDACISLTSTGDTVELTNSYLFQWGGNSTANGTCDATVHAFEAGTANQNTVRITNTAFSGSCSSLTYASSNTVAASIAQFAGWTPTLNFGGTPCTCTYTAQVGEYQVNDHSVEVQFEIAVSALSGSGAATITGLPFSTSSSGTWGSGGYGGCTNVGAFASLTSPILLEAASGSTTLNLFQSAATGTTTVTNSNFSSTTSMRCRFTYFQ